ncbi:alkaline phosphatase (plasmid) [Fulvitalea axinellae]|uniref:Alkaline phosphatase n=1 Tax=Fulvitalea axinellae TaxID=1182444 RepID=A0AAU9D0K9_9BACT|nr:alkaline phosphatase [Fulvitalea axinellae]
MSRNVLLTLAFFFAFPFGSFSQEVVSYNRNEWRRKQNREEIAKIFSGKVNEAIEGMLRYLEKNPDDPEVHFGLSLAYSVKGNTLESVRYFKKSINLGMPFGRFLAGPRKGFGTLYKSVAFIQYRQVYGGKLVHGPALGGLTDKDAIFWLRTSEEADIAIEISTSDVFGTDALFFSGRTDSKADNTVKVKATGLTANTEYFYRVRINGVLEGGVNTFVTRPEPLAKGSFQIAFGGCSAYNPDFEHIWSAIAKRKPVAFLGLGDNVYIDHPESIPTQRFCYYQRQSVPHFRKLVASTPYIGVWDDHDFGIDDSFGGPEVNTPAWKVDALQVFKENFANPGFATDGMPGVWFKQTIGDVDFFFLDGRYYREPSTKRKPQMLGPVQLDWLKRSLKASEATFKVIVTPVTWAYGAKDIYQGRTDTWEGYKRERKDISDFLSDNKIEGVLLLSSDRHRHDAWKTEREGSYPLYEFASGRMSNIHYHEIRNQSLFGYNEKNGFGLVKFVTDTEMPYVEYSVVTIDDETISKIRVNLHQLQEPKPKKSRKGKKK